MTGEPNVGDLLEAVGRHAPWGKAAGWDPVGLQLGDAGAPARRVAVCHEVTEAVVSSVEEAPVDLVVSYHPLLFRPTTRLVAGPGPSGRALRLLSRSTALAVVHTNFDVAAGGGADALVEELGVTDSIGFAPLVGGTSIKVVTFVPGDWVEAVAAAMAQAGAGSIGNYTQCSFRSEGTGTFFAGSGTEPAAGEEGVLNLEREVRLEMVAPAPQEQAVVAALVAAHPYEEPAYDVLDRRGEAGMAGRAGSLPPGTTLAGLATLVAERLGGDVRVGGNRKRELGLAAAVPGSGSDFVAGAVEAGADVLVTGDISHHRAREALDHGMALIDPGHIATERPGVRRLYAAVSEVVDDAWDLTGRDADPWEPGG
ncbi:MAG: Nif3-like dinuclear metal center hexameric protein [Acidimicrobiia bacterium]